MMQNQRGGRGRGRGRGRNQRYGKPYQRRDDSGDYYQRDDDKPPKAVDLPDVPGSTRVWDSRMEQALNAKESIDRWEKYIKSLSGFVTLVDLREAPGGNLLMARLQAVKNEADERARNVIMSHMANRLTETNRILAALEEKLDGDEASISTENLASNERKRSTNTDKEHLDIDDLIKDEDLIAKLLKHPTLTQKVDALVLQAKSTGAE